MKYELNREVREMKDAADYLSASEKVQRAKDMADVKSASRSPVCDPERVSAAILQDVEDYRDAKPFLGACTEVKAGPKDIVLVVAASGHGKSTLSAEIAMSYKIADKPLLIISNEESTEDVYRRLACFELGLPTRRVNLGDLPENLQQKFVETVFSLHTWVKVIAKDAKKKLPIEPTMMAEAIHGMLDDAKGKYSCVILDYYTQIKHTERFSTNGEDHLAQKEFVSKLDHYRDTLGCPLFLFAQARALGGKNPDRADFSGSRMRGSKEVLDKVTLCFEIQKFTVVNETKKRADDLETKVELADHATNGSVTFLYLHKWRRGGDVGSALVFEFSHGRYKYHKTLTPEQVRNLS